MPTHSVCIFLFYLNPNEKIVVLCLQQIIFQKSNSPILFKKCYWAVDKFILISNFDKNDGTNELQCFLMTHSSFINIFRQKVRNGRWNSNATSQRFWPHCGEGYVSQYFEDHKDPFDDDLWPPPKIELKHDLTQITQLLTKIINLFLSKKHFGKQSPLLEFWGSPKIEQKEKYYILILTPPLMHTIRKC